MGVRLPLAPLNIMVVVAQLAEHSDVARKAAGSIPADHPWGCPPLPSWWNGIHSGLRSRRTRVLAGSNPADGTKRVGRGWVIYLKTRAPPNYTPLSVFHFFVATVEWVELIGLSGECLSRASK